jgi:hypothetical protein
LIPTTTRHELKLIRGGKSPAMLGLPCDCCCRQHKAPGECGECAFLAARQRVIAERCKAKNRQRRKTRQAAV